MEIGIIMRTTSEIQAWREQNPWESLDLREANLRGANLRGANLRGADLRGADLYGANLYGADLRWADLCEANLRGANLRGANLRGANLCEANLCEADLRGADLRGANLCEANLCEADLRGATIPHFQIPNGELLVWAKKSGVLVELSIPRDARRTGSLVGRKCRAEFADVIAVHNETGEVIVENEYGETAYRSGERVYPDSYDDDIRVECTHGIHFFLTRAEAEE